MAEREFTPFENRDPRPDFLLVLDAAGPRRGGRRRHPPRPGLRCDCRADPGPPMPRLPLGGRPEGEARPVAARARASRGGKGAWRSSPASPTRACSGSTSRRARCRRRCRLPEGEKAAIRRGSPPGRPGEPTRSTRTRRRPPAAPAAIGGRSGRCAGPSPPRSAVAGGRGPDRRIRPREIGSRPGWRPPRRPTGGPDPPPLLRPDRPAADARGGRRVPQGRSARRL